MFKKDEYIVVKYDVSDRDFPTNYIFKQRLDDSYIRVYVDARGAENGWRKIPYTDSDRWRYATPDEIAEYNRVGKPINVNDIQSTPKIGDVHCKTQEEWDHVIKHYNYKYVRSGDFPHYNYIHLEKDNCSGIPRAGVDKYTYEQWCKQFNVAPITSTFGYLVSCKNGALGVSSFKKGNIAELVSPSNFRFQGTTYCGNKNSHGCMWFQTLSEAEQYSKTLLIETTYKVGDWVFGNNVGSTTVYSYSKNPIKIIEIEGDQFRYDLYSVENRVFSMGDRSSLYSLTEIIRKCEPHEILGNKLESKSQIITKKVSELKYPDVIHITNAKEHDSLRIAGIYLREFKKEGYYLVGGGGHSSERSSYEECNSSNGTPYQILEISQLIFEKESKLEDISQPQITYKVGDKVKILAQSHGWGNVKSGDIGTIISINGNGQVFYLEVKDKAHSWTVDNEPQYIVPYIESPNPSEIKFEVGDEVEVIKTGSSNNGIKKPGDRFIIQMITPATNGEHNFWIHYQTEPGLGISEKYLIIINKHQHVSNPCAEISLGGVAMYTPILTEDEEIQIQIPKEQTIDVTNFL